MTITPSHGLSITHYMRAATQWSHDTFGPGTRHQGVVAHIERELGEVERGFGETGPAGAVAELVDVAILGLDGAWRALMFADGQTWSADRIEAISLAIEELMIDALLSGSVSTHEVMPDVDCIRYQLDKLDKLDTFEGAAPLFVEIAAEAFSQMHVLLILSPEGGSWAEAKKRLYGKLTRNMARSWPDWRTMSPNQPIEHVRTAEEVA